MKNAVLDFLGATIAIVVMILAMVLMTLAERRGAQSVRDEAVEAGVAEYRLDSPTNGVATFHWKYR